MIAPLIPNTSFTVFEIFKEKRTNISRTVTPLHAMHAIQSRFKHKPTHPHVWKQTVSYQDQVENTCVCVCVRVYMHMCACT
jgi:hypothetical protein